MTTKQAHVRWMIRKDVNDVLGLDSSYYSHNCGEAWEYDDLLQHLRDSKTVGMVVAEDIEGTRDEYISGYMVYQLRKMDLTIVRFVVDDYKGQAVDAMVNKLVNKLSMERRVRLLTWVDGSDMKLRKALSERRFRAMKSDGDDYWLYQYQILSNTETL